MTRNRLERFVGDSIAKLAGFSDFVGSLSAFISFLMPIELPPRDIEEFSSIFWYLASFFGVFVFGVSAVFFNAIRVVFLACLFLLLLFLLDCFACHAGSGLFFLAGFFLGAGLAR